MPQRSWTLRRHEDSFGCVLVVTAEPAEIDRLAEAVAAAGYFAFAAVAPGVAHLCELAAFDLIVVLAGVAAADRVAVRLIQPPDRLVELDTDQLPAVLACVTTHLPRTN
jgi:H2-forming N5,N10-methylenetetrahydromethanopterin dehydrogenase-like enzyme